MIKPNPNPVSDEAIGPEMDPSFVDSGVSPS